MEEMLTLVDDTGKAIGAARRKECHRDPSLAHRSVHVLVTAGDGRLLLQKRSPSKDIQPGKWDTSVGGHVARGETYRAAAVREAEEELGIVPRRLVRLYDYWWRSPRETERVRTYLHRCGGPFRHHAEEITEVRFWTVAEIHDALGTGIFTPNFEEEISRYESWLGGKRRAKG